jgi:hypothetical protein
MSRVNGTQTTFQYPSLRAETESSISGISGGTVLTVAVSLANLPPEEHELTIFAGAFSAPHKITATLTAGTTHHTKRAQFSQMLNATFNDLDLPVLMHGGVTHNVAWKLRFIPSPSSLSTLSIKLEGKNDPLHPPALEPATWPPKPQWCAAVLCGRQIEEFARPRWRGSTLTPDWVGNSAPADPHSLSAYGRLDWMHWGHAGGHWGPLSGYLETICLEDTPLGGACPEIVNRKCGVRPLIHPLRVTNASTFKVVPVKPSTNELNQAISNSFSWSDGGQTGRNQTSKSGVVYNAHAGVFIGGASSPALNQSSSALGTGGGAGFQLLVDIPHSTIPTRVFVFLGPFVAADPKQPINLTATLTDAAGTAATWERNVNIPVNSQTISWNFPFEFTIMPAAVVGDDRTLELQLLGATNKTQIQVQAVAVDSDVAPTTSGGVACLPWQPPPSNAVLQAMVLRTVNTQ